MAWPQVRGVPPGMWGVSAEAPLCLAEDDLAGEEEEMPSFHYRPNGEGWGVSVEVAWPSWLLPRTWGRGFLEGAGEVGCWLGTGGESRAASLRGRVWGQGQAPATVLWPCPGFAAIWAQSGPAGVVTG